MELFLLAAAIILVCILALSVRIMIKGSFAETEISRNENMKKLGITCVNEDEKKQSDPDRSDACASCRLKCGSERN